MDLEGTGTTVKYLILDRNGKYPALFDRILNDAGVRAVLTGVRMPRMNATMERWVQTCRRELLDPILLINCRSVHSDGRPSFRPTGSNGSNRPLRVGQVGSAPPPTLANEVSGVSPAQPSPAPPAG